MTIATRIILFLTLMLAFVTAISGQETTTTTTAEETSTAETTTAATTTAKTTAPAEGAAESAAPPSVFEVRQQFSHALRQHPSELSNVLKTDPSLLTNQEYLAGYPEVARFLAAHPEIPRNPRFYLAEFDNTPPRRSSVFEIMLEGITILFTVLVIALALAWLVRTVIEQRRWNRLSRTQSEVHNKILDRLGSNEELLAYIRTPAGTKFLESAPIPLHTEQHPTVNRTPRVLWSIQIGVIVAAGAIGMLLVSLRFDEETAQGLFAMGVIGFCIGAGFIASAAVSLMLAKRLGLWQQPDPSAPPAGAEERGLVR